MNVWVTEWPNDWMIEWLIEWMTLDWLTVSVDQLSTEEIIVAFLSTSENSLMYEALFFINAFQTSWKQDRTE